MNNSGLELGSANWVFKKEPISTFKDYCTPEDREVLEILKEEYSEAELAVRSILPTTLNAIFIAP